MLAETIKSVLHFFSIAVTTHPASRDRALLVPKLCPKNQPGGVYVHDDQYWEEHRQTQNGQEEGLHEHKGVGEGHVVSSRQQKALASASVRIARSPTDQSRRTVVFSTPGSTL